MPAVLIKVLQFIVGGLISRLLISVGVGLFTAVYVKLYVDDYLSRSESLLISGLPPEVIQLAGIARLDDCISIIFGGLSLVATLKSLKLVFHKS